MTSTPQSVRMRTRIADIIQDEVHWFNGWSVSEHAERESCDRAAARIERYLKRIKHPKEASK